MMTTTPEHMISDNMSYNVYLATRNDEDTIVDVIESIEIQDAEPSNIFIYNDCSTDGTEALLADMCKKYHNIHVITSHEQAPYSTARLPHNLNKLLDLAERLGIRDKVRYDMISAGDIILSQGYCKNLLTYLMDHPNTVIISGNEYTEKEFISPRGAGRFIRTDFFINSLFKGRYVEDLTFESAILYEAMRLGFDRECLNDVRFIHKRPNGQIHGFKSYGIAMKQLQYNNTYVLLRIAYNIIYEREFSRKAAPRILWEYIKAKPSDIYPKELTRFIQDYQHKRYLRAIKRKILHLK